MNNLQLLNQELEHLISRDLKRTPLVIEKTEGKHCFSKGEKLLNMISNDYLGIATNPDLREEFLKKQTDLPLGAAGSRLLGGTTQAYQLLEDKLSNIFQKKSLLFNSGYHANTGIIPAIMAAKDIVFCDKLVHASIIDGIKLSGAKMIRYQHLDYTDLQNKLEKYRDNGYKALITSESIFSMDGDLADLVRLSALKKKYDALLMIDEAHSFGLFGTNGYGMVHEDNNIDCDILIGTFGKALGSVGAFAATKETIYDLLVSKSRSFVYSTALPPMNVAWTHFVLKNILPKLQRQRVQLQELSSEFRQLLLDRNIEVLGSSQIIPVIIGDIQKTIQVAGELQQNGFLVLPIRPPTVPKHSCRLRLTLNSLMNSQDLEPLVSILSRFLP
jgi:8-amino-7-oxononanoate synthase